MAVQGVRGTSMWAINPSGTFSWAVWIDYGGPKWVYAQTNLSRVMGTGRAIAYISGSVIRRGDQVLVGSGADPDRSPSNGFYFQESSLEFTVLVDRMYAYATAMVLEL